jgi:hypothetical protein
MKNLFLCGLILLVFFNAYSQTVDHSTKNNIGKQKGYTNITEIDFAMGGVEVVDWGTSTQYTLGLHTINGYQFNPNFSVGIGVGLVRYSQYSLMQDGYEILWKGANFQMPVFLDLRINLEDKKLTPFISCDVGYSFPFIHDYYGGFFVNPSFGIKYFISAKTAMNISIGYRYYSNEWELTVWKGWDRSDEVIVDEILNLFTVKTGFTF